VFNIGDLVEYKNNTGRIVFICEWSLSILLGDEFPKQSQTRLVVYNCEYKNVKKLCDSVEIDPVAETNSWTVHYHLILNLDPVLLVGSQDLDQMTQTQKDQMIEKIYEIVDSHFPKKPNDILIDELCDAFDSLCPVTVWELSTDPPMGVKLVYS